MMEIQATMTERALELLSLPAQPPALILDLGCGSGLSGEVITENGHMWVGLDISEAMLGEFPFYQENFCPKRDG
jgi:18S rRNA (guanine1575-N7)-methyltransferase